MLALKWRYIFLLSAYNYSLEYFVYQINFLTCTFVTNLWQVVPLWKNPDISVGIIQYELKKESI